MPISTATRVFQGVEPQPEETSLPTKKKCSWCKETKPRAEFTTNKNKPDGLGLYCKLCHRANDKAYRARRSPEFRRRGGSAKTH
jgi:hypothetical protein